MRQATHNFRYSCPKAEFAIDGIIDITFDVPFLALQFDRVVYLNLTL